MHDSVTNGLLSEDSPSNILNTITDILVVGNQFKLSELVQFEVNTEYRIYLNYIYIYWNYLIYMSTAHRMN